jgi:hypothetical protein
MLKTSLIPNMLRIEGHRVIKRQTREGDYSSPSSAKLEESLVLYLQKTKSPQWVFGRSRVKFLMVSLEFFVDLILLNPKENWYRLA